MTSFIEKKSNF
jgi:protein disulfide-isomerase A1